MLLIINCKSIYGSDLPEMSETLKRMGHEIVVFGGPMDRAAGDIARARSVFGVENSEVANMETVESRRWAMLACGYVAKDHPEATLVVSDNPSDRAAAASLNIVTVSPFDFNFQWVGEEN